MKANVTNTEVLRDVRTAMAKFAEEARNTLTAVDAEVARVGQWLTHERPGHWKHEIRRREDAVAAAKAAIARKQLSRMPEPASVVEERKFLQREQRRLQRAQERADTTRRWAAVWERESSLWKSSCSGLSELLDRDVPGALADLDRMMRALSEYLAGSASGAGGVGEAAAASAPMGLSKADRLALFRTHVPSGADRQSLVLGTECPPMSSPAWNAGTITEADAQSLMRLGAAGPALSPTTRVLVSWRALELTGVVLVRGMPTGGETGDSGWTIVPGDRPESPGGWRAATVADVLGHWPFLGCVLRLTPGCVVELTAGLIGGAIDGFGRDLWSDAGGGATG